MLNQSRTHGQRTSRDATQARAASDRAGVRTRVDTDRNAWQSTDFRERERGRNRQPDYETMMSDDQIITVVQAHREGKNIEFILRDEIKHERGPFLWHKIADNERWNFIDYVYRVAPEPRKPREWTVVEYQGGIYSQFSGQFPNYIRVREIIE